MKPIKKMTVEEEIVYREKRIKDLSARRSRLWRFLDRSKAYRRLFRQVLKAIALHYTKLKRLEDLRFDRIIRGAGNENNSN